MSQFIYPPPEPSGDKFGLNYTYYDAVNVTWATLGTQNYSLQLLLLWAQDTFAGDDNDFIKSEFTFCLQRV